jgi:hypothetical protein
MAHDSPLWLEFKTRRHFFLFFLRLLFSFYVNCADVGKSYEVDSVRSLRCYREWKSIGWYQIRFQTRGPFHIFLVPLFYLCDHFLWP